MSQIQQVVREEKEAVNSLKIASFTLATQPLYSGKLKGHLLNYSYLNSYPS